MRIVEDSALPVQSVSPPTSPFGAPASFREAVIFDGITKYAEFGGDTGVLLAPPPHKTHYAIPFDVNDDTDRGKHAPKTVSQRSSGHFLYSIVLTF